MPKVIIVNEGEYGWLSSKKGDYNIWANLVRRRASDFAEAVIVDSFAQAKEMVEGYEVSAVIFLSRSMIGLARRLKESHPNLKVILLTGLLDWKEKSGVIVIDKVDQDRIEKELSFSTA